MLPLLGYAVVSLSLFYTQFSTFRGIIYIPILDPILRFRYIGSQVH